MIFFLKVDTDNDLEMLFVWNLFEMVNLDPYTDIKFFKIRGPEHDGENPQTRVYTEFYNGPK